MSAEMAERTVALPASLVLNETAETFSPDTGNHIS